MKSMRYSWKQYWRKFILWIAWNNVIYKKKIDFDFDKKIKNPEWWKNFNNFVVNINGMMIFFIKCTKKIKQRVLKIDGKSV